jgi:cupin 2 domain-containing protein
MRLNYLLSGEVIFRKLLKDTFNSAQNIISITNLIEATMRQNNIFKNLPDASKEEVIEKLISNENLLIERIVSHGQKSPPDFWYDQDRNEIVFLLQGEAEISYDDGENYILVPGDYLNIPAHKKHRVERTFERGETIWLAVYY